jgi:hypothetical protein
LYGFVEALRQIAPAALPKGAEQEILPCPPFEPAIRRSEENRMRRRVLAALAAALLVVPAVPGAAHQSVIHI